MDTALLGPPDAQERVNMIKHYALGRATVPPWGELIKLPAYPRKCIICGRIPNHFVTEDGSVNLQGHPHDPCAALDAIGALSGWRKLADNRDVLRAEHARFSREFPLLAGLLGPSVQQVLDAPGPLPTTGPVPLGSAYVMTGDSSHQVLEGDWRVFATRHSSGDFGTVGNLATATPTDVHLFAPELAPLVIRNKMALQAGFGAVRSRFEHNARRIDPTRQHLRQPFSHEDICIDVVTILGSQPRTYLKIGAADQQCFGDIV